MAEVVVFHHALGLTDAVRGFADTLGGAGHTVHTPDLVAGRTFTEIEAGMAHSEEVGGPMAIVDRARDAVGSLPSEVVYIGFSLGVLSAQALAQTRPGARGAVLCYSALPLGRWGDNWPEIWPKGRRPAAPHPRTRRGRRDRPRARGDGRRRRRSSTSVAGSGSIPGGSART